MCKWGKCWECQIAAGFDIVGDVHGRARALTRLCHRLGYDEWGHHRDGRQMIFLGDLNNKGPGNDRVIRRVSTWVEAGRAHAIMGNHELNTLAWNLRGKTRDHLLPHTDENAAKLGIYLREMRKKPMAYRRHLEFFAERPLWLDMGEFRCVHACWDADSIHYLQGKLGTEARLSKKHMRKAFTEGHKMKTAIDITLTGPRLHLPKRARRKLAREKPDARMRWWAAPDADMARLAMIKERPPKSLKGRAPKWRVSYTDEVPVFFGHYNLGDTPFITASNAACLDFGAGSAQRLTAYRWSGESELSPKRLVSVNI